MHDLITIGKIATRAEISTDTIRYYEQEGLLDPARKSASGYRLYTEEALRRIGFIKQAQHCGFSLSEIRELLALKTREDACCDNVRSLAVEKKLELEHKIKALKAMSQALGELIAICDGEQRPLDECPILAALETSMQQRKRREPAHEQSIKVEVFTSPGCANCLASVAALKAVAETIGGGNISWREVDLLKEMDYAVDLGVLSAPAIAIDGELIFPALPRAEKLQTELARRLKQAGA